MDRENKNINKKLYLDQLEKKEVFSTPEGYFKELPTIIQSSIAAKRGAGHRLSLISLLKYTAVPAFLIAMAVIFTNRNPSGTDEKSVEKSLATLTVSDILEYLENSDISVKDIHEMATVSPGFYDEVLREEMNIPRDILEEELINSDIPIEDLI